MIDPGALSFKIRKLVKRRTSSAPMAKQMHDPKLIDIIAISGQHIYKGAKLIWDYYRWDYFDSLQLH
jgi:hypothetical protein